MYIDEGIALSIIETLESRRGLWRVMPVAHLLGQSRSGIYRMIRNGEIPVIRIGSTLRFDGKALARWIREQSVSNRLKANLPG
jgi:excisionase family DNA binding protein